MGPDRDRELCGERGITPENTRTGDLFIILAGRPASLKEQLPRSIVYWTSKRNSDSNAARFLPRDMRLMVAMASPGQIIDPAARPRRQIPAPAVKLETRSTFRIMLPSPSISNAGWKCARQTISSKR